MNKGPLEIADEVIAEESRRLLKRMADHLQDLIRPAVEAVERLAGTVEEFFQKARLSLQAVFADWDKWFGEAGWGDVLFLTMGEGAEEKRLAALDRLIERRFTRGYVFHPERWRHLERNTDEMRPWPELCRPALLLAIRNIPKDIAMADVYRFLRCETRKEIERDLLDGETLDRRLGRQAVYLQEEEREERAQWGALADVPLSDILEALARLEKEERLVLFSDDDDALVRQLGISRAALWKRRERARGKIAKMLFD